MNRVRHVPLRQCISCRTQRPKQELLRVVRTPENSLLVDTKGKVSGRGAYLCPSRPCLERALKAKLLQRHLETELTTEVLTRLEEVTESAPGEA